MEPSEMLKPISALAKKAVKPVMENASDHSQYQRLIVQSMAPIIRRLQKPLHLTEARAAQRNVSAETAAEFAALSEDVGIMVDLMAKPEWWKHLLRLLGKQPDCRPALKEFNGALSESSLCLTRAQRTFSDYEEARRNFTKTNAAAEEVNEVADELLLKLARLKTARDAADAFVFQWARDRA
ncbi:hypothetical protein [Pseudarthrobacter sp. TAF60_1]|uniref:hypothetical protein n=1 Tax=Pseudarthrobacter sp. TAF60_1 TaxID=3233071 RepID=UPI003F9D501C